jgi:hypothetical protein
VTVFLDIVTVFAISHQDEPNKPKVDAKKNNRLIPNYLQTCSSTFCVYIVEKYLYFYFISVYFSQKNDNKLRYTVCNPPAKRLGLVYNNCI